MLQVCREKIVTEISKTKFTLIIADETTGRFLNKISISCHFSIYFGEFDIS